MKSDYHFNFTCDLQHQIKEGIGPKEYTAVNPARFEYLTIERVRLIIGIKTFRYGISIEDILTSKDTFWRLTPRSVKSAVCKIGQHC